MKITVYTVSYCPFSKQEKEYLKSRGLPFEEKNLEENPQYLDEMLKVSNNFAGTPVTVIQKDDGSTVVLKGFTKEEFEKVLGFSQPATSTPPTQNETTQTQQSEPQQSSQSSSPSPTPPQVEEKVEENQKTPSKEEVVKEKLEQILKQTSAIAEENKQENAEPQDAKSSSEEKLQTPEQKPAESTQSQPEDNLPKSNPNEQKPTTENDAEVDELLRQLQEKTEAGTNSQTTHPPLPDFSDKLQKESK